jgi:hypothetical protein
VRNVRRRSVGLAVAVLVVAALAMGSAHAANPAKVGAWTSPFEEGGAAVPRCTTGADGRIICKPTAVSSAILPNGKVLYLNGLESTENIRYQNGSELSPESRNSSSRVLDVLDGTPSWSTPTPHDGGASNPNIKPGAKGTDDPQGMLGVPGKPGDGLAGSFWGMLGLPPGSSTSPPDDIQNNDGDMFCTDVAQLADGRILIAGGTDWYNEPAVMDRDSGDPDDVGFVELEGLRNARIFDPATNTYSQAGHMKFGRWYPSLVTLADGKVLVASGVTKLVKSMQGSQVRRTETFNPATGQWTENYTGPESENSLPLYPRLNLMPNGKIFYAGAGQTWGPAGQAVDEIFFAFQQFFDPATGKWEMLGPAALGARGGAAQAMLPLNPPYDKGSVLIFGGTLGAPPSSYIAVPISEVVTVTNSGTVTSERTGDLKNARWFPSSVGLPDGTILALSGGNRDEVIFPGTEQAVRTAELYDPAAGTWKKLASGARDRTYHNSAVLLPDGRVLVGGHSPGPWYDAHHDFLPGVLANRDKDPSFEVFSPPYLFKPGGRPVISGAQRGIKWGTSFTISTPNAANIDQVVLSRLPSPQHVTDSDARTIRLAFTKGTGTLTATPPPDGVIAPPGYYYLFILKGGVPSVARIVKVGAAVDATPTVNVYGSDNPPPPDTSLGANPDPDSSYLNQPPPLPVGGMVVGLFAAGAGVPALRRRFTEEDLS